MNNQGLEALANLASASPPQTTDGTASNNASRAERPYVQQATGEHGNQQHPAPAPPASAVHVPPAQPTTQPALSLNSLSTQQLQQLLTAAGGGNNAVQSLLSAGNLNLLGLQQLDTSVLSQLAYLQQLLGLTGSVPNVHPFTNPSGSLLYNNVAVPPPAAAVAAAAAQETVREDSTAHPVRNHSQGMTTVSSASVSSGTITNNSSSSQGSSLMPPPPSPPRAAATKPVLSDSKMPPGSPTRPSNLVPRGGGVGGGTMLSEDDSEPVQSGTKKLQKRAANRLSAQLSRKRKKAFMEELRDENDDLRRKEQILKSIPDLIVVFDSTGKLWFVSQSVSRFLQFSADELEGTSIWERLCEDSVRLLKAAFMDSLAAREADSDTAPLGNGFWELRLVDRDGSQKIITLNGVVHFAGDRPECVCSIRPSEDTARSTTSEGEHQKKSSSASSSKSKSEEASSSKSDVHHKSLIRIKPQQSVVSSGSGSGSSDSSSSQRRKIKRPPTNGGKVGSNKDPRGMMRISDSGNSSGESESASGSGSSDE